MARTKHVSNPRTNASKSTQPRRPVRRPKSTRVRVMQPNAPLRTGGRRAASGMFTQSI